MKAREFCEEMRCAWLAPWKFDEDQITRKLRQYQAALKPFEGDTLQAAWVFLRDNHSGKWPDPATVVTECNKHLPDPPRQLPPREAAIMASVSGQYALREGCGHSFLMGCQTSGRILDEAETLKLITTDKAAAREKHDFGKFTRMVQSIDEATKAHEKRLREKYLKDAA